MILAASILSADFGRLCDEVQAAVRGGAGVIHVDVMDGHFVPNLSVGPPVVRALRRTTDLPLDVHLMIEEPDRYLDAFIDAGANWVSVHVETHTHLQRTLDRLRKRGVRAGVAINPATPLAALDEIMPDVDFVLAMTVNPGFGGQTLMPRTLAKVRALRQTISSLGLVTQIEADGGIDEANIREVVTAGVDIVVAGAAVFANGDPEAATRRLIAALPSFQDPC
jgi:ribulose-phosphate 3-epimerase